MRKRITSLLLTLVMLLSLVPAMGVTASAAEWTTVNSFEELQTAVKAKKEYIKLGTNISTSSLNNGVGMIAKDLWYRENGGCSVRGSRRFCCPNIFQMKGTYAYDRRAQEVPLMLRRRAAPGA